MGRSTMNYLAEPPPPPGFIPMGEPAPPPGFVPIESQYDPTMNISQPAPEQRQAPENFGMGTVASQLFGPDITPPFTLPAQPEPIQSRLNDAELNPPQNLSPTENFITSAVGSVIEPAANLITRGMSATGMISPQEAEGLRQVRGPQDESNISGMIGSGLGQAVEGAAMGPAAPLAFATNMGEGAADRVDAERANRDISTKQEFADVALHAALGFVLGKFAPGQKAGGAIIESLAPEMKNAVLNATKNILIAGGVGATEMEAINLAANAADKYTGVDPNRSLTQGAGPAALQGGMFGVGGQALHEMTIDPHQRALDQYTARQNDLYGGISPPTSDTSAPDSTQQRSSGEENNQPIPQTDGDQAAFEQYLKDRPPEVNPADVPPLKKPVAKYAYVELRKFAEQRGIDPAQSKGDLVAQVSKWEMSRSAPPVDIEQQAQSGQTPVAKETITAAAWRAPDGKISTGPTHPDALESAGLDMNRIYSLPEEANAQSTYPEFENGVEGFVTSAGRFVDRAEAAKIAKGAQGVESRLISPTELSAHDMSEQWRQAADTSPPEPRSVAEKNNSYKQRRMDLQQRISEGGQVTRPMLAPFVGEPWADNYIASMEPPKPPAPDSITSRRAELQQKLRELVAREVGPSNFDSLSEGAKIQAARDPAKFLPIEDAIAAAQNLPEDHPAKIVLHNLKELAKNPRGTTFEKVNTNDVADGTRVEMNPNETVTINTSTGMVEDGIKSPIPEGGIDLYGKKVLPPIEPEIPAGDFAPPEELTPFQKFRKQKTLTQEGGSNGEETQGRQEVLNPELTAAPPDTITQPPAVAAVEIPPASESKTIRLTQDAAGQFKGDVGKIIHQSPQGAVTAEFADGRKIFVRKGAFETINEKGVQGGTDPPMADAIFRADKPEAVTDSGSILGDATEKVKATAHHLFDSAKRFSGQLFPTVTRLARPSGEAAARYIASRSYAKEAAPVIADHVLADGGKIDPKLDKLVGAVLVEDNLRSIRADFERKAAEAQAAGDDKAAQQNRTAAANVRSIINAPGSPLASYFKPGEQEGMAFSRALKDPKVQAVLGRYREWFSGEPDENFRVSQRIAPTEELPTRGESTGARVNLIAVKPGDPASDSALFFGSGRGNLNNPLKKASPFARAAKGTGQGYDISLSKMIENTLGKGTEIANQHRMYDQLIKDKLAVYGAPGTHPLIDGKPTIKLADVMRKTIVADGKTIPRNETLYIRPEASREIRQALAVDAPLSSKLGEIAGGSATKIALASFSEFTSHIGNQMSAILGSPGASLFDTFKRSYDIATGNPETRAQLVELARIGALQSKEDIATTGISKLNPLRYSSAIIKFTDSVARLTADDAFNKLSGKGLVENTETNRRDFVNQLGQYNKRGQQWQIAAARDLKVGPFATAASNFYTLGIRKLLLDPGVKASSPQAALRLRAEVLAKFGAAVGIVAAANYMKWGRVDGGNNTPFGAIRLDNDKDGKTRYFDLLGFFPQMRGLRAVGGRAFIEGKRHGDSGVAIADQAARDIAVSAISPFAGPVVQEAAIATTGKDTGGYQVAKKAAQGESQAVQNMKAAGLHLNPLVDMAMGGKSSQWGKFGVKTGKPEQSVALIQAKKFLAQEPGSPQTPEDQQRKLGRRELVDQMRKAPDQSGNLISQAIASKTILPGDIGKIHTEARRSELDQAVIDINDVNAAMRIYDLATPEEKKALRLVLIKKIDDSKKPIDEKMKWRRKLWGVKATTAP